MNPFLGREGEIGELLDGLEAMFSGQPLLFLVAGEPGIGKTRLIEEFATRAGDLGAVVLWGRCWEAGGAPPYWPWVQSLRTYIHERDPEDLVEELGASAASLAQMIPDLHEKLPEISQAPAPESEAARFRLFEAIVGFLDRASRAQPLVLVLDDLQAADAPSLLLLRFVARQLRAARVLVVGAYRNTDLFRDHPLASAVAEVGREPITRRLSLKGLQEAELGRLVEALVGVVPAPALASAIARETEGNPLFVVEAVRLLAAEGLLEAAVDPAVWPLAISEGVREVIGRRLAHLSERCVGVLRTLSVLGREFRLDVAERVGDLSREELLEVLAEAEGARVVIDVPGSLTRRRFSHALIRDVLYADLGAGRRATLHRRAGEALELLHGNAEVHLGELALHFCQAAAAGPAEEGVRYARLAAEHAAAVLAYEEAARLYGMALEAVDLVGEGKDELLRCEILIGLGDVQARAGDSAAAREAFLAAAAIARRLALPEHLARAALGYGGRFVWEAARGDRNLVPLLEDALGALPETDSDLRARVLARLAGGPLRDQVERELRDRLSREAVEMARRIDDPATLAYALDGRYAAVWWPENLEERLEISAELVRAAEAVGDKERALQGFHYRCLCLLEKGDILGVHQALEAKARLAEELRQPAQLFYLETVRATLAILQGHFGEAEELIDRAYGLGRKAERAMAEIYRTIQLYGLRREQGRAGEVVGRLREAIATFPTYSVLRCLLAHAHLEVRQEAQARDILDGLAEGDFETVGRNDEWLYALCTLAEVAVRLGDIERSQVLYGLLSPYAKRNAVSPPDGCIGSVSRYLALLASTTASWEEAEQHLEDALEMNRRIDARPWVARGEHDRARMLLSRGGSDARRVASESARSALVTASEIGMAALAREAANTLRSLGEEVAEPLDRLTRTFMFTDIATSTRLLEVVGDAGWEDLRRWHDRTLRNLFREHGGEEVDHAGDGFFVAFADPASAVRCAVAIQRRLGDHRRSHGFAPQVRIGLHRAEATRTAEGYAGRGVHQAARIGAAASGGEILVSEDVLAGEEPGVAVGARRTVALKGLSQPVTVVSVSWDKPG